MTHHQYGISALVSQTSFGGQTSGIVVKYRLFSKASNLLSDRNYGVVAIETLDCFG